VERGAAAKGRVLKLFVPPSLILSITANFRPPPARLSIDDANELSDRESRHGANALDAINE
jgi:hypothetical protein